MQKLNSWEIYFPPKTEPTQIKAECMTRVGLPQPLTHQGGNLEPFILIGSTQTNAFVGDGSICCTLTEAMGKGGGQIPMIGINEPCALDEQNQYIRSDGCVGTIMTDGSSPKHNNRVIEPITISYGKKIQPKEIDTGMCLAARYHKGFSNYNPENAVLEGMRIRKLTPKECFRLMGFDDADVDLLIANGISNTQLYKMAGNSIVVNVLEFLFCQLFDNENELWV